jgi:hypothetical protein
MTRDYNNRRMTQLRGERSPRDGKPYYCTLCGAGLPEYLACETSAQCQLETPEAAQARVVGLRCTTTRRGILAARKRLR